MQNDDLATTMRALGHPVRLEILQILSKRAENCCCNDITDCLHLAQSTVSQHLKVLLDAGVIEREARGTRNNYRVRTDRLSAYTKALGAYIATLEVGATYCGHHLEPAD